MRLAVRLAAAAFAVLLVLGVAALWAVREARLPGPSETETVVVIPPGTGLRGIAAALSDAGVVAEPWLFIAAARLTDSGRGLQAGEFAFPAGASVLDAVRILREGRALARRLTVPEGLTSAQIVELLRAEPALSGDPGPVPPEGSLLPETYHFVRGDDRAALVGRMAEAMSATVADLWSRRAEGLPFATPEEAVVLASIVEKETGVADERARVAGVFVNRLAKGMRLQSDPTVVYALTDGAGPLGRSLTRKDLEVDSPYNTYRVAGLPPAPIANPGRAAIEAVLNPERHDYLYFVADGTGGHAFARTLAEHNRNVAVWRRVRDAADD